MNKKIFCCLLMLLSSIIGKAQFTDNFNDGDFTANPTWVGGTADWTVNTSFQLQSNNTVANSSYYLSTASTLALTAQWEFDVTLTFNTSSTNYTDVFLTASASDLAATTTSGYFVRIGNTEDEISLYRKTSGGTITKIIDGVNGVTNSSNNTLKIKVVRDAVNQWILSRDISGTGNAYVAEGSVTDATFTTSAFFGIFIKQSTASFFQRHYFDNIVVKDFVPDVTPPAIQSATVVSATAVDILFNEPLESISSQLVSNFSANNGLGTPVSAMQDAANSALIHLVFANNFASGTNNQLTVNGVKDLAGNAITNGTTSFTYFAPYVPRQYDVVIDEIMADPTPQVGLPNNEWIELRNTSSSAINLLGWKIGDVTGQSGAMPSYLLLPDSVVIVCTSSAVSAMSAFGNTISVTSFPSMDNAADQIFLRSPQGMVIHSVSYTDKWYQNALKMDGGWTLEMIDTKNPCSGISNWKASTDLRGGSPGKRNAVDAVNPDQVAPKLLRAFAPDSQTITLVFDEPLDSTKSAVAASYSISDGVGVPANAIPLGPVFDHVTLKINTTLTAGKVYTITASAITDCVGNAVGTKNKARVGLSAIADSFDIVINEILFNPPPTGNDYVEIYNRSKKIIDLKQTYIANRNTAGTISSIYQLSAESNLLFPEDFMVITQNASLVKAAYVAKNLDAFVELSSMPSFNDDKSTVIILNGQGNIVDQLTYSDKWHFKLIDNKEGVSLERIDYDAPTQSQENWHSAASSVGNGTPTYKNSQYRINSGVQGEVKLTPEIVSPDNDGQDDFATIDYSFPDPGYVANITIFDARGRVVRYLQRNALCGTTGSFRWDGLGEKSQRLAVGVYVVFTEVFNLKGNRKQFKNPIVLARRN